MLKTQRDLAERQIAELERRNAELERRVAQLEAGSAPDDAPSGPPPEENGGRRKLKDLVKQAQGSSDRKDPLSYAAVDPATAPTKARGEVRGVDAMNQALWRLGGLKPKLLMNNSLSRKIMN